MKKIKLFLFAILLPFLSFAQLEIPECEISEIKELGLDQKFDKFLGKYTKPFVGKVFYSIPFKSVDENKEIDFSDNNSYNKYSFCRIKDTVFISSIQVNNKFAATDLKLNTEIEDVSIINGNELKIIGDLPESISFNAISVIVAVPWVLFPLILGALFFTLYFAFPGIRLLGISIRTVKGDFEKVENMPSDLNNIDGDNPDTIRVEGIKGDEGEVSHFQALTAALSATVGLGNIAGVAVAVVIGGAGATFWMIIAGLIGMSSKFVECTLGVKYREVDENGKVYGGPMYYLSKGLGERNFKTIGKILAVLFAIMCIGGSFGGGNMFQANQAASIFMKSFNIESSNGGFIFGLVLAVIVGVVIIGGIKRIANVTEKIVPVMAAIYVGAALIIIFMNIGLVPLAFKTIITEAFAPAAIAGGFIGVLVQGFKRAAFSNEAGIGSAAIAHSAVKTKYAASEGVVALLEPLIDTVIICTMTALVIVIASLKGEFILGSADGSAALSSTGEVLSGVDLTSFVFSSSIPMFDYVLTVAVILFAFSSMISWSYYGLQSWTYLFGKGKLNENIYKVLFCVFVVIGAAAQLGNVLDFSDAMIFAMMVPNMIGLLFLFPVVKDELSKYLDAIKNR